MAEKVRAGTSEEPTVGVGGRKADKKKRKYLPPPYLLFPFSLEKVNAAINRRSTQRIRRVGNN